MEQKAIQEKRRRTRDKVVIVITFLFLVLFTAVEIHLLRLSAKLPFVNSIFFFGLMNLNIVLIMLLLFLIFRNVVKLILDERQNRVGSRLKTRLVFCFILFAIIPTILIFSVSAFYIKSSFDKWFNVKIGDTLQKSINVVSNYYENMERNASHFVRKIAFSLEGVPPSKYFNKLEEARIEFGLDALEYYRELFSNRIISVHPEKDKLVPPASIETLQRHFAGENACTVQNVGLGELVRCGAYLGVDKGVIFADYFVPIASQLSDIHLTYQEYKNNSPLNYPIKSTYFAILSMMTLLILFSATWTGFYVAKRLSVPIEELSKGTEEIAKGNLDYEIPKQGSDELARLVESFNQMTRELYQNKMHIESTHDHLQKVNDELQHRRRYIEVLLESVQSGVISIDSEGRISMINHAAYRLLGVTSQNLLGRPYWALIPKKHREEFRNILLSVYGNAKPVRQELRMRTPQDAWVTLLVTLSVLRDEVGKQMGVVAVFDDVTKIQKMQRMIAWREVAKRIAHEIKNPLTPIQLSVQRIQRRYQSKIDDDGTFKESTNIILNEVDSLKNLVNEFSTFARLPEIQQVPDDLNHVVLEAVNLFRAAHETIRFELNLDEDLPSLDLDRGQLKRVLINLFDNAVAAMENKGVIEVKTTYQKGEGIKLIVADEGCGLSEAAMEQLFEPYFSTKEGGTGLGLAIVQRIVADHGGFVRVVNNQPKGSQFMIELPDNLVVEEEKTMVLAEHNDSTEPKEQGKG